jgi:hypothetical protein
VNPFHSNSGELNMMTLIATAALAAQAPAAPAQDPMMKMGETAEHKADCCKDMAAKHEGHGSKHAEHGSE